MKMAEKYTNNANSHQLVKPWWSSRSYSMVSCSRCPSHIYLSSRSIYTSLHLYLESHEILRSCVVIITMNIHIIIMIDRSSPGRRREE